MKKIILLVLMLAALTVSSATSLKQEKKYVEEVASTNKSETLYVYFPRLPDLKLVPVKIEGERSVEKIEVIRKMIKKLTDGAGKANLLDVIPAGSKLNNAYIQNDTAYIDFSNEFVENHPGGSIGEYNTIYSIVNSLTEIEGIKQVMFFIDGDKKTTYKGHFQFDVPICRDESLIANE